jgi:hypothetical protein
MRGSSSSSGRALAATRCKPVMASRAWGRIECPNASKVRIRSSSIRSSTSRQRQVHPGVLLPLRWISMHAHMGELAGGWGSPVPLLACRRPSPSSSSHWHLSLSLCDRTAQQSYSYRAKYMCVPVTCVTMSRQPRRITVASSSFFAARLLLYWRSTKKLA